MSDTASSGALERARAHFLAGLSHFEAGLLDAAAAEFEAALALAPGRASVLSNLGLTRLHQGRAADALPHLLAASEAEPDQPGTWGALARCHAALGQPEPALAATDRALALQDDVAELWSLRGTLLREARQLPEAATCFERALQLGADPELHHYYLAAVTGAEAPERPPRAYVEPLFDEYADGFEQHLVNALRYQAPERLLQLLAEQGARRFDAALDLGCGTGLCGACLRPHTTRLEGVDLSERMVAQAQAKGCYDRLQHADVVAALQDSAPAQWDLLIAADVFIYVGRLEAVFEGAARALRPGGWLAFTVERAPEHLDVQLLPSLRHAHSVPYLHRLAQAHGLQVRLLQEAPIREDQGQPVPGWYVLMQRA